MFILSVIIPKDMRNTAVIAAVEWILKWETYGVTQSSGF